MPMSSSSATRPSWMQLLLIYFGLPAAGLRVGAVAAALIGMTVNLAAYSTEIIRSGIEAVHRSQIEAGEALGFTPFQVYRHVVLLPAIQKVYPSLCSQFVLMMLASSICSAISTTELTAAASFVQSQSYRSFEVYLAVTGIYLILALALRGPARPARPVALRPPRGTSGAGAGGRGPRHDLPHPSAGPQFWYLVQSNAVDADPHRARPRRRRRSGASAWRWPACRAGVGCGSRPAPYIQVIQGIPVLIDPVPQLLWPGADGLPPPADRRGRPVDGDLRVGLPRRDLAGLHRIGAEAAMGGLGVAGDDARPAISPRHPSSGAAHRPALHRRFRPSRW